MTKEKQKEYNKMYYLLNKEKISLRKKERYAIDEEYRNKLKQNYLNRKRKSKLKILSSKICKNFSGEKLYSIEFLSKATNKTQDFLREWERKGYIPQPLFYDTRDWRLYTEHQIKLLAEYFFLLDSKIITLEQFIDEINLKWQGDLKND